MVNFVRTLILFFPFLLTSSSLEAAGLREHISIAKIAEVQDCLFIKEIDSVSGQLKHASWRKYATNKALLRAKELGASHLLIEGYESKGVFHGKVKSRAYSCS